LGLGPHGHLQVLIVTTLPHNSSERVGTILEGAAEKDQSVEVSRGLVSPARERKDARGRLYHRPPFSSEITQDKDLGGRTPIPLLEGYLPRRENQLD